MPTYDYKCKACGKESTATQSITEEPLRMCLDCGELELERLISAGTSFALKGRGWASDGYGKG